MKPRSKLQKRVVELAGKLPPLTEKQRVWAMEHCFHHFAYKSGDTYWCSDCGMSWAENNLLFAKCPHCGHDLSVKESRKQNVKDESLMDIVTAIDDFQVIRHVQVIRYGKKNIETLYLFHEVCQHWFAENGKLTILAKERDCNHCTLRWKTDTPLSVKARYESYSSGYYGDKYDMSGYIYPHIKVTQTLKRNGLKTSLHGLPANRLIEALLSPKSAAEMLLKTKQYAMLEYYLYRGKMEHPWTINICNRNGYRVKDGSMYHDYIQLLEYFHLDTHNPRYICPKDLKKAHDDLQHRKEAKEAKEREKRRREQEVQETIRRKEEIANFIRHIEPFLGLCICGDGIIIRPLESVTQFYQEYKAMHHCVFTNRYFTKDDSLILSATKDGERLETIELDLNSFSVIQSRAKYNKKTDLHDQIINLVNNNINQIKKRIA